MDMVLQGYGRDVVARLPSATLFPSRPITEQSMNVYLSSAYLAPVQYYAKLYACDRAFIERYDHYMKQTYRNRCIIAAADGPLVLSVPTEKPESPKCLMKDMRISDHGHWRHLHWNALESAYRNSPFYEYYADDFRPFYDRRFSFLYDFNEALRETVCRLIDMHPGVEPTTDYRRELRTGEEDFRERIHPKQDWRKDATFIPQPYYQVFRERHGFLPNLSIVDLLFNMGPESLLILRDCQVF